MRYIEKYLISCGIVLLVTACASPDSLPPPTHEDVVQEALPETTEIAVTWGEFTTEGSVQDGWIGTFNDQKLVQIVDEVLKNNRDIAVAAANVEVAAGLATQAGAQLAPAVAVGGGAQTANRGGTDTNVAGAALNVEWELDIWGKLGSEAAAATESFRASQANFEFARLSLAAQAAKAWFMATEVNLQKLLSEESVMIHTQIREIVGKRVEAGAAQPQDVYLAKADLSAAEDRNRQAIGAFEQSVRSLEVLLGRYPAAELEVPSEYVPVPPPIPVGIPSEVLERRPDVIAAEREVAAAYNRVEAAKAAKLPSITLTASGGRSSDELLDIVGLGGNFFSLGANFVAPLDIGGGLQAQVEIETAQQEAALAAYGGLALRVFSEVESGLRNETLLLEREVFLTSAVENNSEAMKAAQIQYEVGAVDFLSVLQMQTRVLNSRIELVRIKNARLAQRIDLHLALGGDFSE